MRRQLAAAALAAVLPAWALALPSGCAKRRDVTGTGDERLDDAARGDPAPAGQAAGERCGAEGGALLLLDAATAQPLGADGHTVVLRK